MIITNLKLLIHETIYKQFFPFICKITIAATKGMI